MVRPLPTYEEIVCVVAPVTLHFAQEWPAVLRAILYMPYVQSVFSAAGRKLRALFFNGFFLLFCQIPSAVFTQLECFKFLEAGTKDIP